MKHILPIIATALSVFAFFIALSSFVMICSAAVFGVKEIAAYALPWLIVSSIAAAAALFLEIVLLRHPLCKISLFISVVTVIMTVWAFILL